MMNDVVKEYYGNVLQSTSDLKTDACCTTGSIPAYLKTAMANVHDEVAARYYGCGLVMPEAIQGTRILDLGSGSGRDCYVLSQLVGETGSIVGVDMTEQQLEIAQRHLDWHQKKFAYKHSNVEFRLGYIEKLDELNLADESFDIIVSNCVINLSQNKEAVLKQAYRLLKPGGELYFSDVYSDRRVDAVLLDDPVLYGECLSGALYWNDFHNLAKQAGFLDPRLVEDRPLAIEHEDIARRIGHIQFFSATYRLFKIAGLETHCEDYGQAVIYQGGIAQSEKLFALDKHHHIQQGKMFPVCGNTYRMLKESRFARYFEFYGDTRTHYGIFDDCGTLMPFSNTQVDIGKETGGCC